MENRIRAVFLDMDGTLFSHTSNRIPPSAMKALEDARTRGVYIFIATGRHILELRGLKLDTLAVDGWITLNGAYCFSGSDVYDKVPVDPDDIDILVRYMEENPFACQFMEADRMYISMDDERVRESLEKIHTPMPEILDVHRAYDHETFMLVPWAEEDIWEPLAEKMTHLKYTRWTPLAVDAMNKACGKGRGVRKTCEHFGIDAADTLAVGDGPNDTELFEACGIAAAMGNADESLKEKADIITADIDDDGIYKLFEKFGLTGD